MAISLRESLQVGFSDFWTRKVRSFITIIGIVLGTMSIVVVLALVNGINQQTIAWMMERGGLANITIDRNWQYNNERNLPNSFTLREVRQIRSSAPEILYYNPQISTRFRLSYQDKDFYGGVMGIYPDFSKVEEWNVETGRFVSEHDLSKSNDIIVIGTTVRNELFGNQDPIGKHITVNDRRLQVVGVMQHRFLASGQDVFRENALEYLNRRSFIPLSTMVNKMTGQDNIRSITLKAASVEEAPALREKLEATILNLRHGEPVFRVISARERAEEMQESAATFRLIFFLISLISLFVGGIVIMNIMLATIQERTREIGVRLTVGARRRDVFLQFLVQSVLVTTIGGIIGIVFGLSILSIVQEFIGVEMLANLSIIIVALFVSVGVGLFFGISPAIKASKLDPVEALRYE